MATDTLGQQSFSFPLPVGKTMSLKVHCRELHTTVRVGTGEQTFNWLALVVRNLYANQFPQYHEEQFTPVHVCDSTRRILFPHNNTINSTVDDGDDVYVELIGPNASVTDSNRVRDRSLWEFYAYSPAEKFVPVTILFDASELPDLQGSIVGIFGSFNSWTVPITMRATLPFIFEITLKLPAGAPICFKFVLNDDHVVSRHYAIVTDENGAQMNFITVAEATVPLPSSHPIYSSTPAIARDTRTNFADDLATHMPSLAPLNVGVAAGANASSIHAPAPATAPTSGSGSVPSTSSVVAASGMIAPAVPGSGIGAHTVLTASQLFGNTVSTLALAAAAQTTANSAATSSSSSSGVLPMASRQTRTTTNYIPPPFAPSTTLPPAPTVPSAFSQHDNNAAVSHVSIIPSLGISLASSTLAPITLWRVVHEACSLPPGLAPHSVVRVLERVNSLRTKLVQERLHAKRVAEAEARGESIEEVPETKNNDILASSSSATSASATATATAANGAAAGADNDQQLIDDQALLRLFGLRHNVISSCDSLSHCYTSLTPIHKVKQHQPFTRPLTVSVRVSGVFNGVPTLSQEMLQKLFDCDWLSMSIIDICKTNIESQRLRAIVWKYSPEIRTVFRKYANAVSPSSSSSSSAHNAIEQSTKTSDQPRRATSMSVLSACLLLHAWRVPDSMLALAKVSDMLARAPVTDTKATGASSAAFLASSASVAVPVSSSSSTSTSTSTSTAASATTTAQRNKDISSLHLDALLSRPQFTELLIRVAVCVFPHLTPSDALGAFFTHYYEDAAYPDKADNPLVMQVASLRTVLCSPALHAKLAAYLPRISVLFSRHATMTPFATKIMNQCGFSLAHHAHLVQQTHRTLVQTAKEAMAADSSFSVDSFVRQSMASSSGFGNPRATHGVGQPQMLKLISARAFEGILHQHKLLDAHLPRRHALGALYMSITSYVHPENSLAASEGSDAPQPRAASAAAGGQTPTGAIGYSSFEQGSDASMSEFIEAIVRVAQSRYPDHDLDVALDLVMEKLNQEPLK